MSPERTPPPWPAPRTVELTQPRQLHGWLSAATEHEAIGMAVSPAPHRPADARPRHVALARQDEAGQSEVAIVPLDEGLVEVLGTVLTAEIRPYLVLHDAQAALEGLARWNLQLHRLGSTLIAAVLLGEGTRRQHQLGLEPCVRRILGRELYSGPWTGCSDRPEHLALEASVVVPLLRALTPMLRKRELARVYELECRLLPAVVDMQRVGMAVDAARFQRIADGWVRERESCSDADRIARLEKLISTYGYWPREYVDLDGRMRCRLHPLAADSGRFSCSQPNLQQVPGEHVAPGLRACFTAEDSHRLVVADYAQIELRVAAHLAPCQALRQVFHEGRDPHRTTAASITGKPEAEITVHERKLAKAVNFGFLFGMGVPRFRNYARDGYGVDLTMAEARAARDAFFSTFPGLATWHHRVGALGRRNVHSATIVRTALGRRKRFSAGHFSFNAALNIPVQGTAAEGFKAAMIELHLALPRLGARGILCIHDEYIAEVPAAQAHAAEQLIRETMKSAMQRIVNSVPIEVETEITDHWH